MRRMNLILLLGLLAGCVVHERAVVRGEPPCPAAVWVEGHYGPNGHWHPPHWRCPGVAEVVY